MTKLITLSKQADERYRAAVWAAGRRFDLAVLHSTIEEQEDARNRWSREMDEANKACAEQHQSGRRK
jgi:hypothetical protein